MFRKHKLAFIGVLALLAVLAAGIGSYAMAQAGDDEQPAATVEASGHVDYNVSLNVNGDLSGVDPKLQGILPLNVTASGGADIKKTDSGLEAQGDVSINGLDAVAQKLIEANNTGTATVPEGAGGFAGVALSDVRFAVVDRDVYVNLLGSWYDTGDITAKNEGASGTGEDKTSEEKSGGNGGDESMAACLEGITKPDPKAYLKDQKTVGTETIDGVGTTHYTASLDVGKAVTDAVAAARGCGKAEEAARLDAARPQILAAAKKLNVEWWADADGKVHQVKADIELSPQALAPLVATMATGPHAPKDPSQVAKIEAALNGITSVNLTVTARFSRIGEDFQVTKPAGDVRPLKDLMGMFGRRGGEGGAQDAGGTGTAPASNE